MKEKTQKFKNRILSNTFPKWKNIEKSHLKLKHIFK